MSAVVINASTKYSVTVERGALDASGKLLRAQSSAKRTMLVSDDIVFGLYGARVVSALSDSGFTVESFVIAHGEKSKCMTVLSELLERMAQKSFDKSDLIVALGGGTVGDLSGFAAGVYKRGMDCAMLPTTLLAAADASIGGKTAVNLDAGKNLAGLIHQPIAVICDPDVFSTLPVRVFADGAAEVIKYAVISDESLAELLESDICAAVTRCVQIKSGYVEQDEYDTGARRALNFGHTAGHAIERASDYTISHGAAVAAGMVAEARAAFLAGLSEVDCTPFILDSIRKFGLSPRADVPVADIVRYAMTDKKIEGDAITVALPVRPGRCRIASIPLSDLPHFLELGYGG